MTATSPLLFLFLNAAGASGMQEAGLVGRVRDLGYWAPSIVSSLFAVAVAGLSVWLMTRVFRQMRVGKLSTLTAGWGILSAYAVPISFISWVTYSNLK